MKAYLEKAMAGQDLSQAEMHAAMDLLMSGDASPAQVAAFLVALRIKGESVAEIAGGAASMRAHAVQIDAGGLDVVDTCGTGGDGAHTFNISTTAAFVAAGAGVPIAKHGNRAISSRCGSADVLAALGVNVEASPDIVSDCIQKIGIGFLFAPTMHPAMKHAGPVRRELGIRTVFNMLGPLTNPAGAKRQVIGVFAAELTDVFAEVLKALGAEAAFVVHGADGLDEITTTTTTRVSELRDGEVKTYDLDPDDFVSRRASLEDLQGGDAEQNAALLRGVLGGDQAPRRDIVCLNAAAAIVVGGKASDLKSGYDAAQAAIDSGGAKAKLDALIVASQA
jgi:anthranilate phosphoribosyltransferase